MVYNDINNQIFFTIDEVLELATVPKYKFLPSFFDIIFCNYRVLLRDKRNGWATVSKNDFYKIRRQRYAMWKMGL